MINEQEGGESLRRILATGRNFSGTGSVPPPTGGLRATSSPVPIDQKFLKKRLDILY